MSWSTEVVPPHVSHPQCSAGLNSADSQAISIPSCRDNFLSFIFWKKGLSSNWAGPAQHLLSKSSACAHLLLASYRRATSLRNGPTSLGPCASLSASVLELTGQYRIITPATEQSGCNFYLELHQT